MGSCFLNFGHLSAKICVSPNIVFTSQHRCKTTHLSTSVSRKRICSSVCVRCWPRVWQLLPPAWEKRRPEKGSRVARRTTMPSLLHARLTAVHKGQSVPGPGDRLLTVSTIIQALSLGPVARWNVNNDDFSVTTEFYSQYSPHLLLLPGLARTGGTPGGGGGPASWSRGHEAGEVCQVRGGLMLGRWRW